MKEVRGQKSKDGKKAEKTIRRILEEFKKKRGE